MTPTLLPNSQKILKLFKNKNGLEIGGPSKFFYEHGPLPIYPVVKSLDNINYAQNTEWTGKINKKNGNMIQNIRYGDQYIADAVSLKKIPRGKYDFILSCNNLEHIANPLQAIAEFCKVLKKKGLLLIIVPKKESNFDHRRPTAEWDHLLHDYLAHTKENDLTHLKEVLASHDLRLDPWAHGLENFKKRCADNAGNRCLHQHVFDLSILQKMLEYFDISVIETAVISTDYVILGQKKEINWCTEKQTVMVLI